MPNRPSAAHLVADLNPKPSILIGRVASLRAKFRLVVKGPPRLPKCRHRGLVRTGWRGLVEVCATCGWLGGWRFAPTHLPSGLEVLDCWDGVPEASFFFHWLAQLLCGDMWRPNRRAGNLQSFGLACLLAQFLDVLWRCPALVPDTRPTFVESDGDSAQSRATT